MASVNIARPLVETTTTFTANIIPGVIVNIDDDSYIPFSLDSFAAPNLSIPNTTLTVAANKITGLPGSFDSVRVGDIVSAASAGTLTAKSAITVDNCFTVQNQPYIVYPHTVDLVTVGVKAGDVVTGTGIAANTKVDKIDYTTRRIFLTTNCTASGVQTSTDIITFTPPVRVTAVRSSTSTTNPNEIDIDSTVATAGTASTLTIVPGASEAVMFVLKVTPLDNTQGSQLTSSLSYSLVPGTNIVGSASGYNNLDYATLSYLSLPSIRFDLDAFLTAARLPRAAS